MIPDWQTNTLYLSSHLRKRIPEVHAQIAAAVGNVKLLRQTADIWVRDFMPVQIDRNRFVQFRYDPDYLKGYPKLRTTADAVRRMIPAGAECKSCSLVVDGGNVVFSSSTAILTNKVFRENPKLTRRQVIGRLEETLECRVIIIPTEPGDITGHADGVLHFFNESSVLLNDYRHVCPRYGQQVEKILLLNRITFEPVPYCPPSKSIRGEVDSAFGNYVNIARTADCLIVPTFGLQTDEVILRRLSGACQRCVIHPILCRGIAAEGGVLHCASWTVAT